MVVLKGKNHINQKRLNFSFIFEKIFKFEKKGQKYDGKKIVIAAQRDELPFKAEKWGRGRGHAVLGGPGKCLES